MIVRMWEARGHPEAHGELVGWAADAASDLELDPSCLLAEVFTSPDHRVVVIARWRTEPRDVPDPPNHLLSRTPHSWDFAPVDR